MKNLSPSSWMELNRLRGELIDKQIDKTATPKEKALLWALQELADNHLSTLAQNDNRTKSLER